MAIKKLIIENFKCIKKCEIELAPLTIFVGPNGSGKSSILEALALLSQSSEKNVEPRSKVAIEGELVNYDDVKSILHKGLEDVELCLGISIDMNVKEIKEAIEEDLKEFSNFAERTADPSSREPLLAYMKFLRALQKGLEGKEAVEVCYIYRESNSRRLYSFIINERSLTFGYDKGGRERVSEPREFELARREGFPPSYLVCGYPSVLSTKIVEALKRELSKVYYLSVERGSIPWEYSAGLEEHTWVGKKGEYTLEILAKLMMPENDEKRLPCELLCEGFGIRDVWAGWSRSSYLTSNYKDPYLNSVHKLPLLGHGSRQLLPVIVQLAYSDPGSIILVEEPEVSLHPRYQCLLPVLFGRAVNEGKQVLITTHSSYFPLSLDIVLKGEGFPLKGLTTRGERVYQVKLSAKDVIVYHVTRDEREGVTRVEKLELDEEGLKEGIPSFIEEERKILKRILGEE
jgi:predicted ATPase